MKSNHKSIRSRKAPFIASLALACSLATGTAGAGIPVTDVGNMTNHILNQIGTWLSKAQDAAEYGTQAKRWYDEYEHYKQQWTALSMVFQNYQLKFAEDFKKKPLLDGVSDQCGGVMSSITDLLGTVSLNPDEDIVAQQKIICTRIVMLENQKYNDQVDMLNAIIKDTQADIDKQLDQILHSTKNGEMDTNLTVSTANMQQIMANAEQGKKRTEVYDIALATLKQQQKNLATVALNGKSSPIDTIADTLILKGALKVNE